MSKIQRSTSWVVGLSVAVIAGTASADPRVARYPGQMCQIRDTEVAAGFASEIRADFFGRACNAHVSRDIRVTCPVPKLDWKANANLEWGNQWVAHVMRDSHGTFDWDCTAYARDTEGDAYWFDDGGYVAVLGANGWSYEVNQMVVNRHHRYGFNHIQCTIPAGECLAGYTVSFNDGSCTGSGDC